MILRANARFVFDKAHAAAAQCNSVHMRSALRRHRRCHQLREAPDDSGHSCRCPSVPPAHRPEGGGGAHPEGADAGVADEAAREQEDPASSSSEDEERPNRNTGRHSLRGRLTSGLGS